VKKKPPTSQPSPPAAKPWEAAQGHGSACDPLAARFVESLSYDTRLYRHDIAGSIAHARMLAKVGLITADDLGAIERGLDEIRAEIDAQGEAWPGWRIELEDVHMCIEAALIEKVGDAGRKLHTGRSRNDQVALDLRLWANDAVDALDASFHRLYAAFINLAARDGRIVMPSYTHLQRAQPIVVGAELLAWLEAFGRCGDRLATLMLMDRDNPLGSGAIAGSSLALDREATTQALEIFEQPTASSLDATASRDVAIDFVYALAMTAQWLSRWAEQWIIYASTEFGFITLDERYTTGSSMMPQKRNPDMLELIRGRCGNVYGHLVALLTICKGLTIGYNRDLQEDKRHLFAAYDTVRDGLAMAARIVATTHFNEARIADGLDRGFLDATSIAEYLVTRGLPFRTAHQIVGRLVKRCLDRGVPRLADLKIEEFNTVCRDAGAGGDACGKDVYDWLGPANVVDRYRSAGNAGTSGFEAQLAVWRKRLADTAADIRC
jgi:argininosuccinate lyase